MCRWAAAWDAPRDEGNLTKSRKSNQVTEQLQYYLCKYAASSCNWNSAWALVHLWIIIFFTLGSAWQSDLSSFYSLGLLLYRSDLAVLGLYHFIFPSRLLCCQSRTGNFCTSMTAPLLRSAHCFRLSLTSRADAVILLITAAVLCSLCMKGEVPPNTLFSSSKHLHKALLCRSAQI